MRALLFSALLTLAACAQTPAEPPPAPTPTQPPPVYTVRTELGRQVQADMARLDRELSAPGIVSAGAGETADLGGGLFVRPLAIIEDSRCPQNVQCLWAGRMRVLANVSGRETELTLGETVQTPRGAIAFEIASPGPWSEWPSDEVGPRPAFRFGFRRAN